MTALGFGREMGALDAIASHGITAARGRPRDIAIDRAVLDSAGKIIIEQGIAAATIEAIAAKAGTTRASIYRRWPSRSALLVAVLSHHSDSPISPPQGETAREDLLNLLEEFAEMTRGPLGKIGPPIMAEVLSDPASRLAALTQAPSPELVIEAHRRLALALKESGKPTTDLEIRLEAMFGLMFMRALVGNLPAEQDLAARVVDLLIGPR